MASISRSKTGHVRILFYDLTKRRKVIQLGKCSEGFAAELKARVDRLLNAAILGGVPKSDAVWIASHPQFREKFEAVGLVEPSTELKPKEIPTLAAFLDDYLDRKRSSVKPGTVEVWKQVMENMRQHLPKGIRLDAITVGHANAFHDKLKARGMKQTTLHNRISKARQFLNDAVNWQLISSNPFAKVKCPRSTLKANCFVERETVSRILKCSNPTWKLIIALSRYGGLRTPSETLSLRWSDIDWQRNRMHIPEPKVEHHSGRGYRECPLFPELREILKEAWDLSPKLTDYVVDKPAYRMAADTGQGWKNANLRTQFMKLLTKAKVDPWPRLFHSMRASRQTELEKEFPTHVVCAWIGNSVKVARESYLLITEDDYSKASSGPVRETKPARARVKHETKPALHGARTEHAHSDSTNENTAKTNRFARFSKFNQRMGRDSNPTPEKCHNIRENPTFLDSDSAREIKPARADLVSYKMMHELIAIIDQTSLEGRLAILEFARKTSIDFPAGQVGEGSVGSIGSKIDVAADMLEVDRQSVRE